MMYFGGSACTGSITIGVYGIYVDRLRDLPKSICQWTASLRQGGYTVCLATDGGG